MKHHPFTEIWPMMEGTVFEDLKADIREHGLRLPVLTYQDMVLDGRNRERACAEAGVAVRYERAPVNTDEGALDLVVSLNDHRRHLSDAQRAFAAAKLAKLRHGGARNFKIADAILKSETATLRASAKKMGVSHGSAQRAKAILKHGTKGDEDDVVKGRSSLNRRAKELTVRAKRGGDRPRLVSLNLRPLHEVLPTHDQVDPEFTGTAIEFVTKYGHAPGMTADRRATLWFSKWSSNIQALMKLWRQMPELPEVDHNWLRSPKVYDIDRLAAALDVLRPALAEAEALLATAQAAAKKTG